jgi:hypothetical protein
MRPTLGDEPRHVYRALMHQLANAEEPHDVVGRARDWKQDEGAIGPLSALTLRHARIATLRFA